jgi:hypothetical protein
MASAGEPDFFAQPEAKNVQEIKEITIADNNSLFISSPPQFYRSGSGFFIRQNQPERMDYPWYKEKKRQNDTDPKMSRYVNLHECRYRRKNNRENDLQELHTHLPFKWP